MSDLHDALVLARAWRDIDSATAGRLTTGGSANLDQMQDELTRLEAIAGAPPPATWRYDPDWRYFVLSPPADAEDGVEIIVTEESIQSRLFWTKMTIAELTAAYSNPTRGAYTTSARPPEREPGK